MSYSKFSINSLLTIGTETFVTCSMPSCHLDAVELFDLLTTFAVTLNSTESSLSASLVNMTTASTSHTPVCRQNKLAHGSNAVAITESTNIDENTFEDAFMRVTSEVTTRRPLCNIFVQMCASQKNAHPKSR